WYAYHDAKLGQGISNAAKTLKENPELMKEIVYKIKEKHNLLKENEEQPKEEPKPVDEEDKKQKKAGSK
ncbi:DNA recombination/repair protein RecA, partial [bacterium]|nr:DNA recombination/repair protein RecA [bacterium]